MNVHDRTIVNPVIGDRVTFLKTAAETNGECLLLQIELAPHGGRDNPMHYHLTFTEKFEVVEGELHVSLAGHEHVLQPGQIVEAPPKAHHRFYSTSDLPVVFRIEIRPARQFEQSLRIGYGLARDGKTNSNALPTNIWQLALLFQMSETYVANLPFALQKIIFGALARIAHWRGVEKTFDKYLS